MGSRCDTEEGHVLVLVLTEIILPYVVGDGDGDAVHLHYHLLPYQRHYYRGVAVEHTSHLN